jgi:hypothetical protein
MLWHPVSFIAWDSIFGAVGRRAGAVFFARHLNYFIVTRNSQPLPVPIAIGIGTVTQLHRDPWLRTHLPGLARPNDRNKCSIQTLHSFGRAGKKRGTAIRRLARQPAGHLIIVRLRSQSAGQLAVIFRRFDNQSNT